MKKTFESGKIWTILSAVLFFMTCGVFITYAVNNNNGTSSFYADYNTGSINNTLDADEWNSLMAQLDERSGVPDGAIMAFTEECPFGWRVFDDYGDMNGKFLIGGNISNVGHSAGNSNNQIYLTVPQLPSHNHLMKYVAHFQHENGSNSRYEAVDYNYPETNNTLGHGSKSKEWARQYQRLLATSSTGSGAPIDITPSSIRVIYCIKDSTQTPKNGLCGSTHYECRQGSLLSTGLTLVRPPKDKKYSWICGGSNGGPNTNCVECDVAGAIGWTNECKYDGVCGDATSGLGHTAGRCQNNYQPTNIQHIELVGGDHVVVGETRSCPGYNGGSTVNCAGCYDGSNGCFEGKD